MWKEIPLKVLLLALPILYLNSPLFAASDPPLTVSFREEAANAAETGAERALIIQLESRANKVIAAYVIRIEHRESGSQKPTLVEAITAMTSALGLSKGRPGFRPGEKWTDRIPVRALPSPPGAALDLVIFDDGSYWGPDKSNRRERLLGIRAGAALERRP